MGYLMHSRKGSSWKNHKYTGKKIVNGKTVYLYGNSGNSKNEDDYSFEEKDGKYYVNGREVSQEYYTELQYNTRKNVYPSGMKPANSSSSNSDKDKKKKKKTFAERVGKTAHEKLGEAALKAGAAKANYLDAKSDKKAGKFSTYNNRYREYAQKREDYYKTPLGKITKAAKKGGAKIRLAKKWLNKKVSQLRSS